MINQDYDQLLQAQKHHKSQYLAGKTKATDSEMGNEDSNEMSPNVGATGKKGK